MSGNPITSHDPNWPLTKHPKLITERPRISQGENFTASASLENGLNHTDYDSERRPAMVQTSKATTEIIPPGSARDLELKITNIIWQTLVELIPKCRFIILTADPQKPFILGIVRLASMAFQSNIMIDVSKLEEGEPPDLLKYTLMGITTTTCRHLLIDLTSGGQESMFRLLQISKLHRHPRTRAVVVGQKNHEERVLKDVTFRNTLEALYLSLSEVHFSSLAHRDIKINQRGQKANLNPKVSINASEESINLYGKCLYCENGYAGIRLVFSWKTLLAKLPRAFQPFPSEYSMMD
ncbi:hypothetical protein SK128_005686 [Halocaridina rubra]|uniref:Uncharacterized protein n=1 Tax=Halocaridina rubra TaxID=373956 RepID=A0AAN8WM03_HALRR